jgi:hypothetical protein
MAGEWVNPKVALRWLVLLIAALSAATVVGALFVYLRQADSLVAVHPVSAFLLALAAAFGMLLLVMCPLVLFWKSLRVVWLAIIVLLVVAQLGAGVVMAFDADTRESGLGIGDAAMPWLNCTFRKCCVVGADVNVLCAVDSVGLPLIAGAASDMGCAGLTLRRQLGANCASFATFSQSLPLYVIRDVQFFAYTLCGDALGLFLVLMLFGVLFRLSSRASTVEVAFTLH